MTRCNFVVLLWLSSFAFGFAQEATPVDAGAYCGSLGSGEQAPALQRVCRWVNVLPQAMPSFTADQVTSRQQMTAIAQEPVNPGLAHSTGQPAGYQHSYVQEVINTKLTYDHGNDDYSDWYLDAKVSSYDAVRTSGLFWSFMQSERLLQTIFAPQSGSQFKFLKRANQKGHDVLVFEFATLREKNSTWSFVMDGKQINPGLKGEFSLDASSYALVHLIVTTNEIEKDKKVPVKNIDLVADYASEQVGPAEFVLPTQADIKLCRKDAAICLNNSISFKNYHPL